MFRLKGCFKCGGDLFYEFDVWKCLQCGRYPYEKAVVGVLLEREICLPTYDRSRVDRWYKRNELIVGLLRKGVSWEHISELTGRNKRWVYRISSNLHELEAADEPMV